MDNLGSQKELEVIHSHLFEILGYIFQKHRSGADSPRHIRAGLSRSFITGFHPPALPLGSSSAALTTGKAVNRA
ncbi:hypothetical protein [Rothia mucilaginosa]|uniref:hypothetical protein n=1 Tax=Rothia mucilaginosa TaxID=43675 RepID=UPI0028DD1B35|nr:hypothetical protein [Rothia mucilaginosa]